MNNKTWRKRKEKSEGEEGRSVRWEDRNMKWSRKRKISRMERKTVEDI